MSKDYDDFTDEEYDTHDRGWQMHETEHITYLARVNPDPTVTVRNPYLDETGRFQVNPDLYYVAVPAGSEVHYWTEGPAVGVVEINCPFGWAFSWMGYQPDQGWDIC